MFDFTSTDSAVPQLCDLEHSSVPMWIFDRESLAFLAVNEVAIREYGYTREQFLAMSILDIRPSEDIVPLLRQELRDRRYNSTRETWRHRKRDGTLIDVEITSREISFGGRPAEIVTAVNVTPSANL